MMKGRFLSEEIISDFKEHLILEESGAPDLYLGVPMSADISTPALSRISVVLVKFCELTYSFINSAGAFSITVLPFRF